MCPTWEWGLHPASQVLYSQTSTQACRGSIRSSPSSSPPSWLELGFSLIFFHGCSSRGFCWLTDITFIDIHVLKNRLHMHKYHTDKSEWGEWGNWWAFNPAHWYCVSIFSLFLLKSAEAVILVAVICIITGVKQNKKPSCRQTAWLCWYVDGLVWLGKRHLHMSTSEYCEGEAE